MSRILIACEFSGTVRRAFTDRGYDAWSCDLLPAEDRSNRHITGDVRDILADGWDLLIVAHPPCFAGDTLVLCETGYKPIAEVQPGEKVLTHLGRWRRVTEVMKRVAQNVVVVKSTNSLRTVTTPEHPYYARYREPYRNKFRTKGERDGAPEWVPASQLTTRHFTASVLCPERRADVSDDDLWLMGRYVADGHMRDSRWTPGKYEEMLIAVGKHETESFLARVTRKVAMHWNGTAYKATFYGHDAIAPFAQFGRSCETKHLPEWVLALPVEQARHFLDGYISGDGHIHQKRIEASTVSPMLALGVAHLMQRVHGKCPALQNLKARKNHFIQGREVTNAEQFKASVPQSNERLRNYVAGIYAWGHVREIAHASEPTVVFNLAVEEDETYTANGVVVHNCTRLCNSGVRWLTEPPAGRSRADMWAELDQGAALFSTLWNAPVSRVAVENPVMHRHAKERIIGYQPATQSVQPWEYGDWETKRTCLWLRGLPPLVPTWRTLHEARTALGHTRDPVARVHRMAPGQDRAKERSRFFPGIARAMATQWGPVVDREEASAA